MVLFRFLSRYWMDWNYLKYSRAMELSKLMLIQGEQYFCAMNFDFFVSIQSNEVMQDYLLFQCCRLLTLIVGNKHREVIGRFVHFDTRGLLWDQDI